MRQAGWRMTYVSELDQAKLSEGVDDFSPNFVGNIELHHTHVRRAERSIACRSHDGGGGGLLLRLQTAISRSLVGGCRQRFDSKAPSRVQEVSLFTGPY